MAITATLATIRLTQLLSRTESTVKGNGSDASNAIKTSET